ncbi:MAG: RNA polymerase factor sigma-54 [Phycisphaerae bacterium]|nr:RNA polymerase factor sigma-54 [Phycisphaerae bacterium]
MRFETGQHLRLGQHMKLAPKMIQSMEILQLPLLALQERIDQELEANVALELVEPGMREGTQDAKAKSEQGERKADKADETAEQFERLRQMERSYGDIFDSDTGRPSSRLAGERDKKMDAMANAPSRGASLVDQLRQQWSEAEPPEELLEVGNRILEYVNDDGLLGADLPTILDQSRNLPGVPWSLELLERTVLELQHVLEPVGIAARNVRECLLLQIDALADADEDESKWETWDDAHALVRDHFDDLLQNRLPKIREKSGMSIERIQLAKALLKRCNLAPGRELVSEDVRPIIPDVIVEFDSENDLYTARLPGHSLPELRISPDYQKMAKDTSVERSTRDFVSRNVRSASWLIDAIHQRKQTLLRVVNVVLARQREFFDHGPHFLKPLPMVEVAEQLGIHVGTVSRAVAGKWLQTPRGNVELRKFFSGGLETASGEDRSWEAIKALMREVVEAEDKKDPLSDAAISDKLKERGVTIARRTVVKYREQLNIPPARQRKVHE